MTTEQLIAAVAAHLEDHFGDRGFAQAFDLERHVEVRDDSDYLGKSPHRIPLTLRFPAEDDFSEPVEIVVTISKEFVL